LVVRAALDQGANLRLTGPGIETTLEVAVGSLPVGFWELRRQRIRYPMGFDLFLVDGDRVLGVPRSTQVEVL
ncbi:MAG: phosphonate C-P lyase system protein PhnH, partial [Pseudomonadota bacterium]|nr:phosphonate C-P lyase system protein PhnH [Pseudomonadota bacterium]